jgi:excisionase family DNA binding protein
MRLERAESTVGMGPCPKAFPHTQGPIMNKSAIRGPGAAPALLTVPLTERLSYTLQEACAVTGLSESTLRRRAKEGQLRLHRVGGRVVIPADELRRLVGA